MKTKNIILSFVLIIITTSIFTAFTENIKSTPIKTVVLSNSNDLGGFNGNKRKLEKQIYYYGNKGYVIDKIINYGQSISDITVIMVQK